MAEKFSQLRAKMPADAQAEAKAKAKAQAMMAEDETAYLLSNPANAQQLTNSIAQVKAGKAKVRTVKLKS